MSKNIKIKEGTLAEKVYTHIKTYGEITAKVALEKYGIKTFHQVMDYLKNDLKLPIIKARVDKAYKYYLEKPLLKEKKPRVKHKETYGDKIIKHIKEHGSINRQEALELYGIEHFSQRIAYVENSGYKLYRTKDVSGLTNYSFEEKPTTEFTEWKDVIETKPEDMVVRKTFTDAVLSHLKKHKTINSKEAQELYGTLQLPAIIKSLREKGYNIRTSKEKDYKFRNSKVDRNSSVHTYILEPKKEKKVVGYTIISTFNNKYKLLVGDRLNGTFKTEREAFDILVDEANKIYQTLISIIEPNTKDAFLLDFINNGMVIRRRKFTGLFKRKMIMTEEIKFFIGELFEEKQ